MGATTKVIDLAELRDEDDFPSYVAVYGRSIDELEVLSPRVMRWSDDILLFSLDDCRRFWLDQKKKLRCKRLKPYPAKTVTLISPIAYRELSCLSKPTERLLKTQKPYRASCRILLLDSHRF